MCSQPSGGTCGVHRLIQDIAFDYDLDDDHSEVEIKNKLYKVKEDESLCSLMPKNPFQLEALLFRVAKCPLISHVSLPADRGNCGGPGQLTYVVDRKAFFATPSAASEDEAEGKLKKLFSDFFSQYSANPEIHIKSLQEEAFSFEANVTDIRAAVLIGEKDYETFDIRCFFTPIFNDHGMQIAFESTGKYAPAPFGTIPKPEPWLERKGQLCCQEWHDEGPGNIPGRLGD